MMATLSARTIFEKSVIGKPEPWLIEAAAEIGLDFTSLTHETTNELVLHSMKRHGDPKTHGAATIVETDFERIPTIIQAPDMAIIGATRKDARFNAYAKREAGATFLYFEEVLQSRNNQALRGKTLYKVNKPLDREAFIKTVTMNGKTDISKAAETPFPKVIAVGGNPGG
jgi:hypothetical protein